VTHRLARCSCEQLTLSVTADPVRISVCHCLACQQRTGSAFGFQARFADSQVQISGRSQVFVRTGDSGQPITFRFCPICGTTVYWALENLPGMIVVAVGAFADPTFAPPRVSVYESRRHAWVVMPPDVVREV
jgi:hypothetical protein